MTEPLVELTDVCFSYNGQQILDHVNLTIRQDDFIAVIGPNGGGKSTMLKLILGLLEPESGSIRVKGGHPRDFSSAIGYVPQNVNINDHFPITALDVVLMGKLNRKKRRQRPAAADRDEALTTLARLGMDRHAHKKIGALSGGQRQRVFIARALMTEPELLLLDEPTASIDTKGQADFFKRLNELNEEIAILVVSHDLLIVSHYVKSIACVNHGLHYHRQEEITGSMIDAMYSCSVEDTCQVQLLAKGLPRKDSHGHS